MAVVNTSKPVRIGILQSLNGIMSLSERPLLDAALLAVEEINQLGGVLGHAVEPIIGDGESVPERFRAEAERLIATEGAVALFGCWTSASRRAVKPVVEAHDSLLWYPIQYEGLEQSPNIVYTGACPNQQIEPFVKWCLAQGRKRFFLVGSDYVFPRTANLLVQSLLEDSDALVVGEEYFQLDCEDFTFLTASLEKANPDIIINTVNGSGNLPLFRQAFKTPKGNRPYHVCSMSCSEIEYAAIGQAAYGQFTCWSYFQSLETSENKKFIDRYQARFGNDRLVSDPIATAYSQVHLWARIANYEGSVSSSYLKEKLIDYAIDSPLGRIKIQVNRHVTRSVRIGRYGPNGFDIIWESPEPTNPLPWLGVELVDSPSRPLMLNLLKKLPDAIVTRSRLEIETIERKQAEQALRDSEAQLRAMSDAVYDATIMIDSNDRIIFWNKAAEKLFGYSREEALGASMHQLVTLEEDQVRAREGLKVFARTGSGPVMDSVLEFKAVRKDGTQIPVERSVSSFKMGDHWYAVGSLRDISERKKTEEALVILATTDGLTGIFNRRHFMELAQYEIERAKRFDLELCMAMFDVDHFKKINDEYGHDLGDEVLRRIAAIGKKGLRTIDTFARIGGEEFAIIFPETNVKSALLASERLMNDLRAATVPTTKGECRFTVSVGLASLNDGFTTVDGILKAADIAMYRAKKGGRDRIEIFRQE